MRNQACNWATMWGEEAEMRKNDILECRWLTNIVSLRKSVTFIITYL
jgi:hypothetical protein